MTLTTPRGTAWTVPPARPLDVVFEPDAFEMHWRYLAALGHEKPYIAREVLAHTRRLAERHTKQFRRCKQTNRRYEQSTKNSS